MPGMDGLQLPAAIKQHFTDLPVMMVTAYGDDERRRRADELGAADFLAKPVDFDELKAQLRQLPIAATEQRADFHPTGLFPDPIGKVGYGAGRPVSPIKPERQRLVSKAVLSRISAAAGKTAPGTTLH